MLFRVELIVFSGAVYRWCAELESEVLSTMHSAVADNFGALGATEPNGRGADKQGAFPTQCFAVAGDRDMDAYLPWGLI